MALKSWFPPRTDGQIVGAVGGVLICWFLISLTSTASGPLNFVARWIEGNENETAAAVMTVGVILIGVAVGVFASGGVVEVATKIFRKWAKP